jgi:hypothetical protein
MMRQRHVDAALAAGTFTRFDRRVADALAGAGVLLALATLVLILFEL